MAQSSSVVAESGILSPGPNIDLRANSGRDTVGRSIESPEVSDKSSLLGVDSCREEGKSY